MSISITATPTASLLKAQAERETAARAGASDQAAVALAELYRVSKGTILEAVANSRHGIVAEEAASIVNSQEFAEVLLRALIEEGAVELYQAIYRLPRGAA